MSEPGILGDGEPLRVGVTIPFNDHQSAYSTILEVAERVELAGFDSVWMADHLTGPTPYGATVWHEVVTLLAAVSCHAPSLTVGTDILVTALRPPLLAAKMLATLDIVSGGKLIVATGVGYLEEEFKQLGVPFHERAELSEECIAVWKAVWSDGNANFTGRFFTLQDVVADPKPIQRPGPPVWLGGGAPAVLRRAARIADGWHPISLSLADYQGRLDYLERACREAERDRPLTLSYSGGFGLVGDASGVPQRVPLSGSVQQVVDDVQRLQELGVSNIVFRFGLPTASNQEILDQISYVGESVLPALDRSGSVGDL